MEKKDVSFDIFAYYYWFDRFAKGKNQVIDLDFNKIYTRIYTQKFLILATSADLLQWVFIIVSKLTEIKEK